jgi:cytosine/adenosine deaminase-related metal-dependent hydrolase
VIITAQWILPIDQPPMRGGWVEVSGATIVGVGRGRPPASAHDLGAVAVLPGLVNAHTHLELSWMAGKVGPASSMADWIAELLQVRRRGPDGGVAEETAAMQRAIRALQASGTVLVGDISNTLASVGPLAAAGLGGVVFHELLGFDVIDAGPTVRRASAALDDAFAALGRRDGGGQVALGGRVVAHAPYSVSPALFTEIAAAESDWPLTVHVGESVEELEFLRTGEGPMRQMLETLERWAGGWQPPGSDPVAYLDRLGYLQPGMLAVHATHLDVRAIERLRDAGAVVVTCPRSNVWVGSGLPRLSQFYATGVPVAIGTDSLASVATLSVFDELAELRRLAPDVAPGSLLESATRIGAEALGFGRTHGTIAAGKHAALVAVDVPADVTDVEEYLVGGVETAAVRSLS